MFEVPAIKAYQGNPRQEFLSAWSISTLDPRPSPFQHFSVSAKPTSWHLLCCSVLSFCLQPAPRPNSTHVESTRVNSSQLESTRVNSSQLDPTRPKQCA